GSMIYSWGQFDKLPNVFNDFDSLGYNTSFYYGGRLQFDNMEAYLRAGGVKKMVGENDFTIKRKTSWGAYDDEVFALQLAAMNQMKPPFFSMLGTLTTHEWWSADVPKYFTGDKDPLSDAYRNTIHYSDSCLYNYIKKAQQQKWYDSTIFLIMADHGCRYPLLRNNYDVERHHIPMMIIGGALKDEYKGTVNNRVASHTDIAATIFAQLDIENNKYPRSKNIFNPYGPAFAYYAFDNGFGFVTNNRKVIYDNYQQKDILNDKTDSLTTELIKKGKAYLQCSNQFLVK
ncbi:MAG: LTA synthase family protein, partial [Pseudomonadota bacterium]